MRVGVVTVSDRASGGVYEDRGGPAIRDCLEEWVGSELEVCAELVPDEQAELEAVLVRLVDEVGCGWVLTTGGTGPSRRDVSPEAVEAVVHKRLPGFGEAMRQASLAKVATAILSRQTAGVRFVGEERGALLIALPGSPKAIRECLEVVFPAIPHTLGLIGAGTLTASEAAPKGRHPKH